MLETGRYDTLRELAEAEKINEAYFGRVIRLTLLSPQITEAILPGQQPDHIEFADLLKPFPVEWGGQNAHFKFGGARAVRQGDLNRDGPLTSPILIR
jgi:hypothetical protein